VPGLYAIASCLSARTIYTESPSSIYFYCLLVALLLPPENMKLVPRRYEPMKKLGPAPSRHSGLDPESSNLKGLERTWTPVFTGVTAVIRFFHRFYPATTMRVSFDCVSPDSRQRVLFLVTTWHYFGMACEKMDEVCMKKATIDSSCGGGFYAGND
jgi:hypothetical protein